jgi:molybdate transport system substrate-binding protein
MTRLKMLAAGATEGPVRELLPEFAHAGGPEVDVEFSTVGALRDRFVAGEKADVVALSTVVLEALGKEGRFVPGSQVEFGRATCGVAIRDGFLMPNIATPEAFKKALLNACPVAQTDPAQGGSSGIYFAADGADGHCRRDEGQADLRQGRLRRRPAGPGNLRAELGVTFTSEFIRSRACGWWATSQGIRILNAYGAAIPTGAQVEPARALLSFLTSPSSKARFAAFGLE